MLTIIAVTLCFLIAIGILALIARYIILTARRNKENDAALATLAPELGLSPVAGTGVIKLEASGFTSSLFTGGSNPRTDHALEGRVAGLHAVVFNYTFEQKLDDGVAVSTQTVAAFAAPSPMPLFLLQKKSLLSKMKFHKIHLENNPEFEKRFVLTGSDSSAVQDRFGPNLAGFLLSTDVEQKYTVEGSGPWLVFWQKGSMRADQLRSLLDETSRMASGFFQHCGAVQAAKAG